MSATVPESPIIKFLPYQRAWLTDQSRFKIGMFTRRGGKTFGSCGEIVDDCCKAEIDRRKVRATLGPATIGNDTPPIRRNTTQSRPKTVAGMLAASGRARSV